MGCVSQPCCTCVCKAAATAGGRCSQHPGSRTLTPGCVGSATLHCASNAETTCWAASGAPALLLSLTTSWMGRHRGSPLTHRLTRALAQSLPSRFCGDRGNSRARTKTRDAGWWQVGWQSQPRPLHGDACCLQRRCCRPCASILREAARWVCAQPTCTHVQMLVSMFCPLKQVSARYTPKAVAAAVSLTRLLLDAHTCTRARQQQQQQPTSVLHDTWDRGHAGQVPSQHPALVDPAQLLRHRLSDAAAVRDNHSVLKCSLRAGLLSCTRWPVLPCSLVSQSPSEHSCRLAHC